MNKMLESILKQAATGLVERLGNAEVFVSGNADTSDEKYMDGDAFEENLRKTLTNIVPTTLANANPAEGLKAFNTFICMAGEVAKFSEVQKTKRKEIEKERDVLVNKMQSQKEIILAYLEKSFVERKENFANLFSVVDKAIENNNMQQLAMGLDSINQLAVSSPFKDLATIESTAGATKDKNHEWDF